MKVLEFFQEDNGGLSSSRLFAFLVTFSAIIDWQHAIWTLGKWSPSWEMIGLVLGVVGAKVLQKSKEEKEVQPPAA